MNALRIQISGHGFINITAESAFCTNGLWTRAFDVHKSLKGLRKLFEQIVEHLILCQMEKYLSSTSELALSGFCSDHFHGSYQVWVYFIFPIRCSYQTKTPLHVLSFPNSGNSSTSEVALSPNLTDKASSMGWTCLGHVWICPCMSQTVIQLTSKLKTNHSISHGSEYCLCIGVEANFYGWCNTIRQVDGTTQEFVSGTFSSVISNSAYWPNTSSR